ncbi:MAG: transcription-repair coupling factor [Bacteroidaceae bacterium]|nr:transcription-repair coupling factor [Bacteroidaceae bacterium]
MELNELLRLYGKHPTAKALGRMLASSAQRMYVGGNRGSSLAMAFASLADKQTSPLLFIMDDVEEAGYLYHDLAQALGEEQVLFFPSSFRRAIRFGQRDAANEILRTQVLGRLAAGQEKGLYIVSYPEALAELVVTRQQMTEQTLTLRVGEHIDMTEVEHRLTELGFRRVDYVYEPGQMAVRGSIIDVYGFSNEYPYRIDFMDDEVDSIRSFEVRTQLSVTRHEEINIVPETDENGSESVLAFLPADCCIVAKNITFLCDTVNQVHDTGFSERALAEGEVVAKEPVKLVEGDIFRRQLLNFRIVEVGLRSSLEPEKRVDFDITPQPVFHKNFELVSSTLQEYIANGYTIYILADSPKQNERLKAIFEEDSTVRFTPVNKTLHAGYADNTLRVCLFTDHQIFDRFHKYTLRSEVARRGKMALTLRELQQFEVGDYVVHTDHGVGRFGGLVRIMEAGQMQEKIKIIYQHEDVVYVSIHALHKVSKYKGREGETPRLNRLGGGAWERLKERTKEKIKDIARDLIRLYATRQRQRGFQFSPDGFMQHELEASFLYEDTPDQMRATQQVKQDMELPRPMDRLVCGDVGFGKTEVAIRAAFKAACDGKQVALMVPTTVLAYQHYRTFTERLKDFPVRVEYLSRARTAKQTTAILRDLKEGRIDILIGTHKLIGKAVEFRDLGLLIIDEEQKFGVATKEKLRQMRTNVDTLTLTATPIPRTLQFSLMGARDLSVIQTPPPNRYPIQTELHVFSPEIIAEAVNFEMSRNGQVFLVCNRISRLPELAEMLHQRIPDARIAIGHGQMPTQQLEDIMLGFANYDYDVLVSTTIIESGLDIPNANTIIIIGAEQFGLSDLHQMRGRVGRSNKKAFCLLMAPPLASLATDARRRLEALENFSDLGSGIYIAMQDLDIRGAGNLLGAEQSGFIADLGYETYQKILAEAVNELKTEEFHEPPVEEELEAPSKKSTSVPDFLYVPECQVESDISVGFPDDYVPGSSERMLLYRELDGLDTASPRLYELVQEYRQRLIDRFGPVPAMGEELIAVVPLRHLGRHFGCERITLKGGRMRLHFTKNTNNPFYQSRSFGQLIAYAAANPARCQLAEREGRRSMLFSRVTSVSVAVALLQQIGRVKA